MTIVCKTSPLLAQDALSHGFFGRKGGYSDAPYDTLNCGPGSNDDPQAVQKNRQKCADHLNAPKGLITPYQTHSNIAAYVDSESDQPKADALVTKEADLAIGILTADCMPVLFADMKARIIGAAHAGWRGALDDVLENCIDLMQATGSAPTNIRAVIGPCLFPPHFQVSADLFNLFTDKYEEAEQFFNLESTAGKYQLDLRAFAKWRLTQKGLFADNIATIEHCTLAEPQTFFSYRHTKQNGLADYGRNLSAICLQRN